MGLSTPAKTSNCNVSSPEKGGMGLLVVFFPEDSNSIDEKSKLSSAPSPSSTKLPVASSFRRSNSNSLLSKARSAISICALLVFVTLLLFFLSTFESTVTSSTAPKLSQSTTASGRILSKKLYASRIRNSTVTEPKTRVWSTRLRRKPDDSKNSEAFPSAVLQGVGTLYRRGTRAMSDLVVGHVVEDITDDDLRLFLRLIHRSGLTARADLALIFVPNLSSSRFGSIIEEENESFLALLQHYRELFLNSTSQGQRPSFHVEHFFKLGKNENQTSETLWGKRTRSNFSNPDTEEIESAELIRANYGSVLSFEVTELDPENALAGFLDHIPMSLRRWACYPMLLGRVRRNFKRIMLVDVKNLLITSDPLSRLRSRNPESVYLYTKPQSMKHIKKNPDQTQSYHSVNSAIVMGGARGVRRLSNTVLTEIVRATMQHRKSSVTESVILSQLVGGQHTLKNVNLITSEESIPDTNSLNGHVSSLSPKSLSDFTIIQRGNTDHGLNSVLLQQTCSFDVDSSIYQDC